MKIEQTAVGRAQLASFLDQNWGAEHWPDHRLTAAGIAFIPLGEDSYCYSCHPTIGAEQAATKQPLGFFARLEPADGGDLDVVVRRLDAVGHVCALLGAGADSADAELTSAVVAPLTLAQAGSSFAKALSPGFAVTMFPLLAGSQVMPADDDGSWVPDIPDRIRAAEIIGTLHRRSVLQDRSVLLAAERLGTEDFGHTHRQGIESALRYAAECTKHGFGGTCSAAEQECCALLIESRAGIQWLLEELDELQRSLLLATNKRSYVLTHQEPHLANFCAVHTSETSSRQLRLIDWGGLLLGPPERDLFALLGDPRPEGVREAVVQAYLSSRFSNADNSMADDILVRPEVMRWYELRWVAQEVDDYATRIFEIRQGQGGGSAACTREQIRCLDELKDYLPVDTKTMMQGTSECGLQATNAALEWCKLNMPSDRDDDQWRPVKDIFNCILMVTVILPPALLIYHLRYWCTISKFQLDSATDSEAGWNLVLHLMSRPLELLQANDVI